MNEISKLNNKIGSLDTKIVSIDTNLKIPSKLLKN